MGVFDRLTQALGIKSEMNVDDFMSATEAEDVDVMHKQADFYVKPIALQTDQDIKVVEEELRNRNIVLLNISPIARNAPKLKEAIEQLRAFTRAFNGDIARIDEDKILLTPTNVKIVKRKH